MLQSPSASAPPWLAGDLTATTMAAAVAAYDIRERVSWRSKRRETLVRKTTGAQPRPGADRKAVRQRCHHASGGKSGLDIPVIPSGSLALDAALGVGGIPRGRMIEIYGPEASGKTTLALHVVASAQRSGG